MTSRGVFREVRASGLGLTGSERSSQAFAQRGMWPKCPKCRSGSCNNVEGQSSREGGRYT